MKKLFFLILICALGASAHAQLARNKWKGSLQLDNMTDVILSFGTDSLKAIALPDSAELETMVFKATDTLLTIKKVYGRSDCDENVSGKYKYTITMDELLLTLVADDCEGRSQVLNNSKWTRIK
jgi:hypothetical protein